MTWQDTSVGLTNFKKVLDLLLSIKKIVHAVWLTLFNWLNSFIGIYGWGFAGLNLLTKNDWIA